MSTGQYDVTIKSLLASVARLALDAAPIIYFVEAHPRYDALITAIFRRTGAATMVSFPDESLAKVDRIARQERRSRSELQREAMCLYI